MILIVVFRAAHPWADNYKNTKNQKLTKFGLRYSKYRKKSHKNLNSKNLNQNYQDCGDL